MKGIHKPPQIIKNSLFLHSILTQNIPTFKAKKGKYFAGRTTDGRSIPCRQY